MAATLSVDCDPLTSWYTFNYSLSWSYNCEVADILSDIPVISVGILVFGVSLLFLVTKRVSLSAVWLFSSVSLAFAAALVDLGKTLADEVAQSTTTLAVVDPFLKAREILFAFSIGLRFLFYWSYVAEPPRKDLSAISTRRIRNISLPLLEPSDALHSGSWIRWGLPGKLLASGLLAAIMTSTVLQIVWRVVPRFHQYSSIYATDAALELLVSFLLLLKVLLNTVSSNSPDSMLVHTFRECLAPISGLLVNIAIGVGGLLSFAFSESTVGRILQAFEVYIIVMFVVILAFLKHHHILLAAPTSQSTEREDVLFTLPEPIRGSTFRISPPCVETPRMSMMLSAATQNVESGREALRRSARRSLHHVSSWVSSRILRNRSHNGDEEVKLWNAENAKVNPPYTRNTDTELRASIVSSTQGSRGWGEHVREAPTNHLSIISALDAQSAMARSMQGSVHSGRVLYSSQADVPQRIIPLQVQTGSIPDSSIQPDGTKHAESITKNLNSPAYGFGGVQSRASPCDSRTSLDELLRQQSQLDQSIEALKVFSGRTSADSNSVLSPKSVELSRSPSTGQRTVCSEVSLSNFPVPPWSTTPCPALPSTPGLSTIKRIREERHVRLAAARTTTPVQDTYAPLPTMASASFVDLPKSPRTDSIPHTPLGEENESLSADTGKFGGTQYNVTSFIGGLATPREPRQGSKGQIRWLRESDASSHIGNIGAGSSMKMVPRRTLLPAPARPDGTASPVHSPRSSRGDIVDRPVDSVRHGSDEQTAMTAVFPPTLATDSDRGRETEFPTTVSKEGFDGVQRALVRPRPPPLAIKPYVERKLRNSAQVLADD